MVRQNWKTLRYYLDLLVRFERKKTFDNETLKRWQERLLRLDLTCPCTLFGISGFVHKSKPCPLGIPEEMGFVLYREEWASSFHKNSVWFTCLTCCERTTVFSLLKDCIEETTTRLFVCLYLAEEIGKLIDR